MDILCVGQLVADILVRPMEALEFTVDTRPVDAIHIKPGGDCLNAAIALKKLGNDVGFCGKVGRDHAGAMLGGIIRDMGIDTRGLLEAPDTATSSCLVAINGQGERTFFYFGGANEKLTASDVPVSLMDECKILHVGGAFSLPELDGDGAASLFRKAKSNGKTTSMDVTWDARGRWLDTIRPCLPYLDYFMPSIGEAQTITGKADAADAARFLLDEGVGTAVIKLGKQGCLVMNARETFTTPAYTVKTADTTGAGDCFVAGFLTGLLRNWPLTECAGFGCAVAAQCVTQIGATTGVLGFEETIRFMRQA
ncbi:MAG: carbohydrate kinase family protein [Clostridia bacterium]|nr:carbohydrate kinase family protein [Clostridia bacterium]